ncbi:MAG TPA: DUF2066 domain-containing protein [Steroidobacteraceae bacterium]|nr:DUF2066 domain-containing protein [Steroidobacteraceae bacterium]
MTSTRSNVGRPPPARRSARGRAVACVLAWLLPAMAPAAEVMPYQAVVALGGPTEAERAAAFGEALKVAAVRASGRSDAAIAPRVVAAAADPASYVQQYSTTTDRMLKVGFDPRAMEQLLQQAGLPRWPSERPVVTVMLFTPAVAAGARAVTDADRVTERLEVERAAQLRGVPIAWPTEALDPAAARARLAGEPAGLLGLGGDGSSYEWVFAHAGRTLRVQGGIGQAVGAAADALAARYAPASTSAVTTVRLRIGGVADVRDYAALTEYLEGLSLVRSVGVREFERDSVQFDLGVRGDAELLRRIFALDGRLTPAAQAPGGAAGIVDFVWQSS